MMCCYRANVQAGVDRRNGIEQLNDELIARGFAMNEEGGILKVAIMLRALMKPWS